MRVLRRVLLLVLVLLVVAAIALVIGARPDLEDARDEVDARWDALAQPLDERYARLEAAVAAARGTPGSSAELVEELETAIGRWYAARDDDAAVADQVAAANDLEGLARRFGAVAAASPRLSADPEVTAALAAYRDAPVPEGAPAFTEAVRHYEDERDGPLRAVVATVLGYDEIPALALPTPV